MAFTLKINSKGLFRAKGINFGELLNKTGMSFGSENEFHILTDGELSDNTGILFNPKRIGRGIFIDMRNVGNGELTVSYNIPTTAAEIRDFVSVVKEIGNQFGKASYYCEEEEREYTLSILEKNIDNMIAFSVEKLNDFARNKEFSQLILTLARFPWYIEDEKRSEFMTCRNLDGFEEAVHNHQKDDVHYAKPSLFRSKDDGRIFALYTMTDDCESIFPIDPSCFVGYNNIKIEYAIVNFYDFGKERILEGTCPYSKFVDFMKQNGAVPFDAEHLRVPGINIETITKFVDENR